MTAVGAPRARWIGASRAAVALCGLLSVSSLLAWVYDLGSFSTWFVACSVPSTLALAAVGWVVRDKAGYEVLRLGMVAGATGGLVGTLGYDLFRVPFVAAGYRLLAPIDSYGVLALNATHSSPVTGLAGWGYHFANGIGFGIAYGVVARGRHWGWAVLWAMVLETASVVTPFSSAYGLRGHWDVIALAYAAHLFYGIPLGLLVQRSTRWNARSPLPVAPWIQLTALAVVLTLWHSPWRASSPPTDPRGAAVTVSGGRFHPAWVRAPASGCSVLINRDSVDYSLVGGFGLLPARGRLALCHVPAGVHRVRLSNEPYSGGFLISDRQLGDQ
jgi:hypothetical protein